MQILNIINVRALPPRNPRNPIRKRHEPPRPRKTGREAPDRRARCNDLGQ